MNAQTTLLFDGISSGAVIFVSIVFSVLFWYTHNGNKNRSLQYLGMMYPVLALYFIFSIIFYISDTELISIIFPLSLPLVLLILPLFNFYVQSMTKNEDISKRRMILHFAPSLVFLILLIPFYFLPHQTKLKFVLGQIHELNENPILSFVRFIFRVGVLLILNLQFLYYLFLFIVSYKNYKKKIFDSFSFRENIDLKWLAYAMYAFTAIFVLIDSSKFLEVKYFFGIRISFNFTILFLLTYLGIHGLFQKNILSELKPEPLPEKKDESLARKNQSTVNKNSDFRPAIKYKSSNLTPEKKENIKQQIIKTLQSGFYRNPMLSLEHLADQIGTNSTYLSQVINEEFKQNFYQLVNQYRIEEAGRLLIS
jgi:AraC-like DNA-binding protein